MSDATRPYRPANGSEGDWFMQRQCFRCERDSVTDPCRIQGDSFAYDIGDPRYPAEWVQGAGGANPRCTAFEPARPKPKREPVGTARRQLRDGWEDVPAYRVEGVWAMVSGDGEWFGVLHEPTGMGVGLTGNFDHAAKLLAVCAEMGQPKTRAEAAALLHSDAGAALRDALGVSRD